jgi:hypothetical protein
MCGWSSSWLQEVTSSTCSGPLSGLVSSAYCRIQLAHPKCRCCVGSPEFRGVRGDLIHVRDHGCGGVYGINPRQVTATGIGTAPPVPRATKPTRTSWPTWFASTPASCGRWPATAPGRGTLPAEAAYPPLIGIQVFQHGDSAAAHAHIRATRQRLTPGGLFCLRVNATDVWPRHEVTEHHPDGGFTVRYLVGPSRACSRTARS